MGIPIIKLKLVFIIVTPIPEETFVIVGSLGITIAEFPYSLFPAKHSQYTLRSLMSRASNKQSMVSLMVNGSTCFLHLLFFALHKIM